MFPALLLPTRPEQQLPPPPADPALAWPPEAVQLLHEYFRQHGDAELARLLQGRFGYGYDARQVEHRRRVYNLHRSEAEVEAIRRQVRRAGAGKPKTRAPRTLPEGTERTRLRIGPNGQVPVRLVKTAGRSKPLAVLNYEKAFGPVPKGHIVTFRDGNPENCEAENLLLLTRAENVARNRNNSKAAENKRAYHAQQHAQHVQEYARLQQRLQAVQARAELLRTGGRDEVYTQEQLAEFLHELAEEEKQLHLAVFRLPESAKQAPERAA